MTIRRTILTLEKAISCCNTERLSPDPSNVQHGTVFQTTANRIILEYWTHYSVRILIVSIVLGFSCLGSCHTGVFDLHSTQSLFRKKTAIMHFFFFAEFVSHWWQCSVLTPPHGVHKMFSWPLGLDDPNSRRPSNIQSSSSYSEPAANPHTDAQFLFSVCKPAAGRLCWYKSSCLQHVVVVLDSRSWTEIFIK